MSTPTKQAPVHITNLEENRIVPAGGNGDNVRASWRYSLDSIKSQNSHCDTDAVNLLCEAFMFCTGPAQIRFHSFCQRVDYDHTSVDQIFRGRYKPVDGAPQAIPAKFLKATRAFLDIERERVLGGRNEFVKTPTAEICWNACDIARESQTPVYVYGPSQIGKTWAFEHYQRDHNHGRTVYIRMEAAGGLGGMIRAIAQALRISPKASVAGLKKSIRNALDQDMVLIFDEMHLLQYTYREQSFFACMEVIREIYDHAKCGMVLCGTELLEEKMKAGKDKELKQVLRRGVHRFKLPDAPTVNDVSAILEHWNLRLPPRGVAVTVGNHSEEPYELLRMLSKRDGLKAITERLRYARKLAKKDGLKGKDGKVTWSHFIKAHLIIEGESLPGNGGWE